MATEAQTCAIGILANRRNAQKSTSPRTLSMSLGLATAKRFAKTSAPEDLFMQNKPNLLDAQMNVSSILTNHYENEPLCRRGENKPNQTQFQTKCTPCEFFLFFTFLCPSYNLAWIKATEEGEQFRNPDEAVQLAQRGLLELRRCYVW